MDELENRQHSIPSYIKNPQGTSKPDDKSLLGRLTYTIQSFINDPFGVKGIDGTKKRKETLEKLGEKYRLLLRAHKGKFAYGVYKVADSIIVNVKVPSESVEGVTYDVAVEFLGVTTKSPNLLDKNIRIFSNNSAFVFTHAYVFEKEGLLIPYFRSKLPAMSLTQVPKVRNPDEILNYEKSVVFAMSFIREHRLYMRENYVNQAVLLNKLSVKGVVRGYDEVDQQYKMNKKLQSKAKEKEKAEHKAQAVVAKGAGAARSAVRNAPKPSASKVDNKVNSKVNSRVASKVKR